MAEVFKENRSLQSLDVRFNDLGDIGTTALTNALKENTTLQNLGVASTELGQFGRATVSELLEKRLLARNHCTNFTASRKTHRHQSQNCHIQ